jgi:hypothetical protein
MTMMSDGDEEEAIDSRKRPRALQLDREAPDS